MGKKNDKVSHINPGARMAELIEQIEGRQQEIAELNEAIKDIYATAKDEDISPKALKEIVRLRKMDSEDRATLYRTVNEYLAKMGNFTLELDVSLMQPAASQ